MLNVMLPHPRAQAHVFEVLVYSGAVGKVVKPLEGRTSLEGVGCCTARHVPVSPADEVRGPSTVLLLPPARSPMMDVYPLKP